MKADMDAPSSTSPVHAPASEPAGRLEKKRYHHGELRQALIDATRALVLERGAENFSLADACRLAGVTTAAPYRHFKDKDELLGEVCAQAFDAMAERQRAVAEAHPKGSIERIVALGRLYVANAVEETALFRLMFGQNPTITRDENVADHGADCFGYVIEEVADYCVANGLAVDPQQAAVQLWTFVHGAACLLIDDHYAKVAPGVDVDAMIADAGRRILSA